MMDTLKGLFGIFRMLITYWLLLIIYLLINIVRIIKGKGLLSLFD